MSDLSAMPAGGPAPQPDDQSLCAADGPGLRLPEFSRPPRPERVAAGWERRFMADSARLDEFVALYTQLGFQVEAEPVLPDEIGPECEGCRLLMCRQFVTVYTRRAPPAAQAKGGAGS